MERLGYEDVFVGGHPMAGSEKTGYESSTDHLLENAYYIITPTKKSTPEQIDRIRQVALGIGALPIVLDYHEHDFSVAAISICRTLWHPASLILSMTTIQRMRS